MIVLCTVILLFDPIFITVGFSSPNYTWYFLLRGLLCLAFVVGWEVVVYEAQLPLFVGCLVAIFLIKGGGSQYFPIFMILAQLPKRQM